jgi:hypothetical protein
VPQYEGVNRAGLYTGSSSKLAWEGPFPLSINDPVRRGKQMLPFEGEQKFDQALAACAAT